MEEFSHDGDDDLLPLFPVLLQSISELFEERIEDARIHCGHEEGTAKMS